MVALRNRRVLDRGSGELASGRHLDHEYVFGASGAAAVYRRQMLEDVAYKGEFFDEIFFAYREDVDLAWRAQHRGWRCRYLPTALARHRRRVAPGRRAQLPAWINRISLANRWRMIAKNETSFGWRHDWPAILGRDLATIAYCVLREQKTLLAVGDVAHDAGRLAGWRRHIARSRSADPDAVMQWFGRMQAEPAPPID
jgi:GT2 family glycosyltransferase